MSPRRWNKPAARILAAVVVSLACAGPVPRAFAGSIGFKTDAEVKAGPGIDIKVTLTNTGDEAASDVSVRAELLDKSVTGAAIPTVAPGQNQVWNLHLADSMPNGIYAAVLRVRYADANGYPFEVISLANALVGEKAAPRIFGNVDVPNVTTNGEATAKLNLKRPPGRTGKSFEVRLVAPVGLEVRPDRITIEFDDTNKAPAEFRVRNLKLLAGTTLNVFGFITGEDPGFPQMDTIRGSVRITSAAVKISAPMFYEAAIAVFLLSLILEGYAWAVARRREL